MVQATPEEILQVPNVKTKPPVTWKIPTCNKMEKSGMYKEPCSGKKLTYKSSNSFDPRGLFSFQMLKQEKSLPFPGIHKADTASAACTRPMSLRVVKLDGTLSDPVFLHAKNVKEPKDAVHNAVTNRPIRKDTVSSIQENGYSSFEDYGKMKNAKAGEKSSKSKRKFSNSLAIPENYRSDPKRFSDVEVKLRRLDMCTGNTSDDSCRNSLAAVPITKPNTASAFNQLKSVEITTGLESTEGVDEEPVDIINVISEPKETENFTADHTGILKQSEKGGLTRKRRRTTKRKLNATENEVLNEIIEIISESAAKKGFAADSSDTIKTNQRPKKSCIENPTDYTEVMPDMMEHAGGTRLGKGAGQYLSTPGQSIPSPPPLVRYGYASSSAAASSSGQPEKVSFAGIGTNYGFLRLFPELKLANKSEDAGILIIPADENFITSRQSSDVFKALVGRKRLIVSSQWVTDSLMMGSLQDKKKFLVKGTEKFGEWSPTENYHGFEYQVGDGTFSDITTDDIRHLLNAIGGKEQLVRTQNTIYVCADGERVTSDHIVPQEWIFKCITSGTILSTYQLHERDTTPEHNPVSDTDAQSSVVSSDRSREMPEITDQSKRSKLERKPSKRLCCVYCEVLTTKLARHLEDRHSSEPEVAKAVSLPKKSKERLKIWAQLAAKGSYIHNSKVKMKGSGDLIVKYKLKNPSLDAEYLPCEFCNADFSSVSLWKHHKTCPARPAHAKSSGARKNARKLLPAECQCSNELKKKVLKKMRENITENSENNQIGATVDRRESIENNENNQTGVTVSMDRESVTENRENNQASVTVSMDRESVAENRENNQTGATVDRRESIENNENNQSGATVPVDRRESIENNENSPSGAAMSVDRRESVVDNNENNQSGALSADEPSNSATDELTSSVSDTSGATDVDLPSTTATNNVSDTSGADDNRMLKKRGSGKKRKDVVRTPWSKEEKDVVENDLKRCFKLKILPKKMECIDLIEENPVLFRRSWTMIKDYVRTRLLAIQRASQKAK